VPIYWRHLPVPQRRWDSPQGLGPSGERAEAATSAPILLTPHKAMVDSQRLSTKVYATILSCTGGGLTLIITRDYHFVKIKEKELTAFAEFVIIKTTG
jgi:hypothetical protein